VVLGGASASSAMHEIEDKDMGEQLPVTALIDGKPVPPDTPYDTTPGDHVVRGEAAGYAPQEKKIHAVEGLPAIAQLELQPLPAWIFFRSEEHTSELQSP